MSFVPNRGVMGYKVTWRDESGTWQERIYDNGSSSAQNHEDARDFASDKPDARVSPAGHWYTR